MRQTYTQPLSSHWAPLPPSTGVAVVAATAERILQRHTGVHPAGYGNKMHKSSGSSG